MGIAIPRLADGGPVPAGRSSIPVGVDSAGKIPAPAGSVVYWLPVGAVKIVVPSGSCRSVQPPGPV